MRDRYRIHCAIFLLKNEARYWGKGTKTGVELRSTSWETFKQLFFEKYFSKIVRARKLKEFLDLKQGSSVAKYARRFEQGCLYAPFIARDESEKIGHFIRGLNPIIRRDFHLTSATTLYEVVDRALAAEQDELEIRQWRVPQSSSSRPWKKRNTAQTKGKPEAKLCKKRLIILIKHHRHFIYHHHFYYIFSHFFLILESLGFSGIFQETRFQILSGNFN